ncbi:sugar transferase [Sphaerotilus montanus]|jgi:lipopolysaccharide/colanic/teichoic acid biosynthesis glycosyltransferase|uniref:Lipopolysaccharide/colanic/teichoic acid biosynthesis glycosyltransferase n=1 Tax=Sphaerotilus montanus TaxID=522889 RepID=A0A7Y9QYH6_9BURK|nr:sugar transferase [Sphaerotilus montanus]NYG32334.1 lipopolysaccharide/colanic/teichoic acid biosynthesis glycosyltransferase [Sphaerotilus montanus]NZD56166.1 sugar transferase [Sphaerotilus montanus]
MAKRLFDLLLSSLGLAVLALPLALVALAIKLDSPGPVFYRQVRVGLRGREFRIHKFRTMAHDPGDRGPQLTVGLDARITRVGAFLRRTKLDELAQLFDVFEGTMSLVGPRPEVPRYVALYPAALREKVLSVRPGITDFASIEYRDESTLLARSADPERTYREVILPTKLALQARYVDRSGLGTDLVLIGRTVWAIIAR